MGQIHVSIRLNVSCRRFLSARNRHLKQKGFLIGYSGGFRQGNYRFVLTRLEGNWCEQLIECVERMHSAGDEKHVLSEAIVVTGSTSVMKHWNFYSDIHSRCYWCRTQTSPY